MKTILKIILVTDDTAYAEAFAEAVAATQRGLAVSVIKPSHDRLGTIGRYPEIPTDMHPEGIEDTHPGNPADTHPEDIADTRQGNPADTHAKDTIDTRSENATTLLPDEVCVHLVDDGAGEYGAALTITVDGASAPAGTVGKYAGCGRICGEARAAYAALQDSPDTSAGKGIGHDADVISFIGLEGGAGASSVAMGLAGELAAYRGKKTMYMSFETFESPRLGVGARMASCKDVSVFMFQFLRSLEKGGAGVSAESYLSRDDYGTIRFIPSPGFNRLHELSGDRLVRFITAIAAEVRPDVLILDWGSGAGADAAEWLRASAHTIIVGRHGGIKSGCGDSRAAHTRIADELGIDSRKSAFVINRQPAETIDELPSRFVGISEDPHAFERDGDSISISLATAFGTGIKKLADVLFAVDESGEEPALEYLMSGDDHVRFAA